MGKNNKIKHFIITEGTRRTIPLLNISFISFFFFLAIKTKVISLELLAVKLMIIY